MATNLKLASERWEVAWRRLTPGNWQSRILFVDAVPALL